MTRWVFHMLVTNVKVLITGKWVKIAIEFWQILNWSGFLQQYKKIFWGRWQWRILQWLETGKKWSQNFAHVQKSVLTEQIGRSWNILWWYIMYILAIIVIFTSAHGWSSFSVQSSTTLCLNFEWHLAAPVSISQYSPYGTLQQPHQPSLHISPIPMSISFPILQPTSLHIHWHGHWCGCTKRWYCQCKN